MDGRLFEMKVHMSLVQAWSLRTESKLREEYGTRMVYQSALIGKKRLRSRSLSQSGKRKRSESRSTVKPPGEYYPLLDFVDEAFKFLVSPIDHRTMEKIKRKSESILSQYKM